MALWPNFVGPSYRLESPNVSADRAINIYLEQLEKGPRAGQMRYRGIPGLPLFTVLPGNNPIQALFGDTGGQRLFTITGGTLYEVFQDGTHTAIPGNIAIGTNPAIIATNGFQLAIASAGQLFIAPGGGAAVVPVNDTTGAPVNAATVAMQDNYFIAGIRNSKTVQISNLAPDGAIWDPGNESVKEAFADNIVRVWVDQPGGTYLWLFGNDTYEVWSDTGNLFPFERVQDQVYSIGCDSAWSVAGVSGYRFWTWRSMVYMAQGFQAQRISDHGVEQMISALTYQDRTNSEGFAYIDNGHPFFVLSFPISGLTVVYDVSNASWHERYYFLNGQYQRYRPRVYATVWGKQLVGDYNTSRIYTMEHTFYKDADIGNGPGVLKRERVAPYLTDQMKNERYNRMTVDIDTGVGLEVPKGQPGYDPLVCMKYSNNRGKNWSYERTQRLGMVGETLDRPFFTQLGGARIGFASSLYVTDPVPFSLNNVYLDHTQGTMGARP